MKPLSRQKAMLVLRSWVLSIVGIASFIAFAFFLARHWDYYGLARPQRPLHAVHDALRSSGRVGLWTGIVATGLFVLNLGYLVRKRLVRIAFLGPLRMWMDLHVLTGFIGMGIVVFHSSFAPSSALGMLAIGALATTVATGIVGRTIYVQVPRSLEGRELELGQVQAELNTCRLQLEQAGVQADWLEQSPPEPRVHQTSLVGCFMAMAKGYGERQREYRQLKRHVLASPGLRPSARKILPLARDFCIHSQWFVRYHELRSLIASWRFFHRWLAVLMFCIVVCHIIVAIRFGDLHLWGGGR
ncbi:MAG: hypothetical protein ABFR33_01820 [Verrucomicrobiota bacterium]